MYLLITDYTTSMAFTKKLQAGVARLILTGNGGGGGGGGGCNDSGGNARFADPIR